MIFTIILLEPYKLEALIIEDLKYNGTSKMKEIKSRLSEIDGIAVQKTVYKLAHYGKIGKEGADKNRVYFNV